MRNLDDVDREAAAEHYKHMRAELVRLLTGPAGAAQPCPCPRCTAPADAQLKDSLALLASRLRRCGCEVSVPEKISRSQGMDALVAMTRTLHAIKPLTSHAGS